MIGSNIFIMRCFIERDKGVVCPYKTVQCTSYHSSTRYSSTIVRSHE